MSPLQGGYSPASMFQGQDAIFLWEQGKRGSESITLIFTKYLTKICHLEMAERRKITVETFSLLLFETKKMIAHY